jgi:hypothetical protein
VKVIIVVILVLACMGVWTAPVQAWSPGGDIKQGYEAIKQDAKQTFRACVEIIMQLIAIGLVGWTFSFVVDRETASMVKIVTILCLMTEFIRTIMA